MEKRLVTQQIFILIKYLCCKSQALFTFAAMPESFSRHLVFEKKTLLAVIIPQARKDGMYYEVNIKGYPRFYMSWSALGRYDIAGPDQPPVPYPLVLEVSDLIEKR